MEGLAQAAKLDLAIEAPAIQLIFSGLPVLPELPIADNGPPDVISLKLIVLQA